MIELDVESLLSPVPGDLPAGLELSYDPDFQALEIATQGKAEQQFGDTVIAAEEPDWPDVARRAEALLGRTKDLRVGMWLMHALIRMHQIEGLAAGLALVHGLLDRFWNDVHPELDHEDHDDPTMRLNALAPLANGAAFLRDLRNARVVASARHGRVLVKDVLMASGKLPASDDVTLTQGQIAAILAAYSSEDPEPLKAAMDSADRLDALEALLTEKGVLAQAPDLRPLSDALHALKASCAAALGGDVPDPPAVAVGEVPTGAPPPRIPGAIASREDAIRALDDVCKFIERTEPSNPAPLLIRRAQRLMSRNFVEIIQDLAPESLEQIQKLAGIRDAPT